MISKKILFPMAAIALASFVACDDSTSSDSTPATAPASIKQFSDIDNYECSATANKCAKVYLEDMQDTMQCDGVKTWQTMILGKPVAGCEVAEEPAAEPADPSADPAGEGGKAEEPKAEEPKAEEPKADEPKADEPKAEEPKADEPKADEPKADEPKTEVSGISCDLQVQMKMEFMGKQIDQNTHICIVADEATIDGMCKTASVDGADAAASPEVDPAVAAMAEGIKIDMTKGTTCEAAGAKKCDFTNDGKAYSVYYYGAEFDNQECAALEAQAKKYLNGANAGAPAI